MKKVTVIIPAYNAENYINRMLQSILNQTYKNVECIVVNDGSTDKTLEILNDYINKFKNVGKELVILNQKNKGQAAAINFGLKRVTGEYFIWADSDDFFQLNAFEILVKALEENNCDFVRANAIYRKEDNIDKILTIKKQKDFNQTSLLYDYLNYREERIPTYIGIMLTRFDYFKTKNKGLDIIENRVGQNLQLILPIVYRGKAFCLNKEVYNYVIRDNSHSRQKRNVKERIVRMYQGQKLRIKTIRKIANRRDKIILSLLIRYRFFYRVIRLIINVIK